MRQSCKFFVVLAGLASGAWPASWDAIAETARRPNAIDDLRVARGNGIIAEVWFSDPTTRYRHFVLGSPYEPGTLNVKLRDGRKLLLSAGSDAVFEDRQPRLADLDGDGVDEIVVVKSYLAKGAALAVLAIKGDALEIIAETAATGRPNTWLNPAGIADFDGDGRSDVAFVQMPHVLGLLRVVTLRNGRLVEIAQISNCSNHVIGSPQLGLSAVGDFNGDGVADIAVASLDRTILRIITFRGGAKEIGRIPLGGTASGDFRSNRRGDGRTDLIVPLTGSREKAVVVPAL